MRRGGGQIGGGRGDIEADEEGGPPLMLIPAAAVAPAAALGRRRAVAKMPATSDGNGPAPKLTCVGAQSGDSGNDGGGALSEVVAAYKQLWGVVQLPAVWGLSAFLLRWEGAGCPLQSSSLLPPLPRGYAFQLYPAPKALQYSFP